MGVQPGRLQLIYENRLDNAAISEQLGFCDAFHFSRRFKRITGMTTRDFRRSLPGHYQGGS